jgi:hypothetical protein
MPSAAEAFATAQEAVLRASTDLQTAMALGGGKVRLYDEIPVNAPVPYVSIGERQTLIVQHPDCEAEVFATVQWWSRKDPLDKGVQARAMGAAIIGALLAQLTLDGWDVDEWEIDSESYSTDPDQSTHGRAVFHYLLTEQT